MHYRHAIPASATSQKAMVKVRQNWQTRWGFLRRLRFEPDLEAAYLSSSQQGLRYQSLIASLLGAGIWLLFLIVDSYRLQLFQHPAEFPLALWQLIFVRVLVLACLLVCALACAWPVFKYRQSLMVVGVIFLVGLGSITAIYCYQRLRLAHESSVLILVIMAMFLPLGQRFTASLSLALTFVATVLCFAWAVVEPEFQRPMLQLSLLLLMSTAVAGVWAYLLEYSNRQQFLLRRELEWLADHDPLTGLHNRRMFSHHLDLCIRQAHREQRSLALVLMDVDHFKLFNDSYGHQTGDQALIALAELLKDLAARPLDLAARVGGEEMALIFFDVDAEQAQALCERLVCGVQNLAIPHASSPTASCMTVSAGCALLGEERSEDPLYQRADKLLYQVKHKGRNGFVLGLPPPSAGTLRAAA